MTNNINISYPSIYPSLSENTPQVKNDNMVQMTHWEATKLKERVENLTHALDEVKKDPHFYTKKRIFSVAIIIVAIAAAVTLAYFCWGTLLPMSISFLDSIRAAGRYVQWPDGIPMCLSLTTPLAGFAALGLCPWDWLFRNQQKDIKELNELKKTITNLTNSTAQDIQIQQTLKNALVIADKIKTNC